MLENNVGQPNLTPKGPNQEFFGNIAISGNSLQMEFLLFSLKLSHMCPQSNFKAQQFS